jgi:hypothetical protein
MPSGTAIAGVTIFLAVAGLIALAVWSRNYNLPPRNGQLEPEGSAKFHESSLGVPPAPRQSGTGRGKSTAPAYEVSRSKVVKQRPLIRPGVMRDHFRDRGEQVDNAHTLNYKREVPHVDPTEW